MSFRIFVLVAMVAAGVAQAADKDATFSIDGVELPAIPSKVSMPIKKDKRAELPKDEADDTAVTAPAPRPRPKTTPGDSADLEAYKEPLNLDVAPGHNEVITISKGYLNRIVTPFNDPVLRTANSVTTKVEGNVVYVATGEEKTIAMFILDSDGGPALSLSLVPRAIPPREIRLKLKAADGTYATPSNSAALPTETAGPYQQAMMDILVNVAKGQIPTGYQLAQPTDAEFVEFYCALPGSTVELTQVLSGNKWRIGVHRVRNNSHFPIEVKESDCQSDGVLAIAPFPSALIEPGQEVELYIARLAQPKVPPTAKRRPYVFTH